MNILLPIIANVALVLFTLFTVLLERKNGLLAIVKTVLFAGGIVGAYFLTPIVLPLLEGIPYIGIIDITSPFAFYTMLAMLSFIALGFISLIIAIIRLARNHRKLNPRKPKTKVAKIKTKKIQAKPTKKGTKVKIKKDKVKKVKVKKDRKAIKAKRKERKIKVGNTRGKRVVAGIFGFLTAIMVAFVAYMPVKLILKDIIVIKPELDYLETVTEYTPIGQIDNLIDIENLIK